MKSASRWKLTNNQFEEGWNFHKRSLKKKKKKKKWAKKQRCFGFVLNQDEM